MFTALLTQRAQLLTSPFRALPDFLIIGTQVGGSAALFHSLCKHPEILAPRTAEIRYFTRSFREGESWYRSHFPIRLNGHLTGEASSDYMWDWHTPNRVRALMPNTKIIAVLRDPVERAWAHYRMLVRNGVDVPDFEQALEIERDLARPLWMNRRTHMLTHQELPFLYSFRLRGLYAEQLRRWWQYFPREQTLVLAFEDFLNNPEGEYRKVLRFLHLAPHPTGVEIDVSDADGEMHDATRAALIDYFEQPNEELFSLLGRRYAWATKPAQPHPVPLEARASAT